MPFSFSRNSPFYPLPLPPMREPVREGENILVSMAEERDRIRACLKKIGYHAFDICFTEDGVELKLRREEHSEKS